MTDSSIGNWIAARFEAAKKINPNESDARAKLRDEVRRAMDTAPVSPALEQSK